MDRLPNIRQVPSWTHTPLYCILNAYSYLYSRIQLETYGRSTFVIVGPTVETRWATTCEIQTSTSPALVAYTEDASVSSVFSAPSALEAPCNNALYKCVSLK